MKRIIALLIVTVLCLGMLASCEVIDQVKDMIGLGQPESGATVADAISFLDDIYKTKKETTLSDFDVVAQVKIDGVVFPVTWTSDNEKVSIRESTKTGFYTVDLPDQNTEEFSYKLTATIAVDGVSESRTYSFKMPAVDNGGITSEPVEGVAYKLFLLQGGFNQRFYALNTTQNNENKFINTTLEPKEAPDFFVEKVEGGYKWYTMVDGVKTYVYAKVERTENADTGAVKYSKYIGFNTEEGSVFTFDENKGGVWTVKVLDLVWGVGTYGTYTTISISEDSYFTPDKVGSSQYVVQFMTSEYANTLESDKLPEAEDDAKAILDQLYALADGESASGNFKLTGKITALDSYNNPTIVVEGYDNMPVYCYRLTDDRFVVGATITVSALQMKNYGGTYEFMSCTLESIELPGESGDPDATEMTIPEVLAAAEGTVVKVTGTVESFYYAWDDNYGNCSVYIVDEAGNKLLAFRLATKVAIGDNITVTGTVSAYNGVNQIAQGCTAVINSTGGNTNPETPALGIVTEPEVGKAYKFGLYHGNESATVYFNGQNYNNYAWYLAYSATGVDVYLEAVEGVDGGYRLYFMNGDTKTYIRVYQDSRAGHENDGTIELVTSTPAEYFTFSTEYNTLLWTNANGAQSYLGSSGTYKSISCSNISYITNDNSYIAHLYAEGAGSDEPHEHVFVNGKCECGAEDPNYVPAGPTEMTIPEVLASSEGTQVIVKGTVCEIYQAWNPQFNNVSFYISDEAGNKLLIFRTGTDAKIGDQVTVTGTATLYNSVIQIAQGSTTVIDEAHVCSEFSAADCLNAPKCVVCGAESGEALGHDYVNGTCSRCGATEVAGSITASKEIKDLITELGWSSSTTKQSFTLDDNVSVKIDGGNNTGKAYNGDHIRIYATDTPAGTITITVANGYELVSVKVTTATGTYAFLCVDGSDADISNVTTAVSGSSVVLNSVKNGSDGKQVRVMAIEVIYKATAGTDTPVVPHEHVFVEGKCECGAEDPNYVPPHEHVYVDGKCECGAEDPNYVAPETPVEGEWQVTTELKTGDHVLIGAPAYGKLLSATKTGFYNIGVDYSADNFANVTDAEIFVVTVNADGSYTFTSLTGDVIALADSYSSLNVEGAHKSWTLTANGDDTFLVYNTGRSTYLEWYSSKNNWSTYTAGNTNEYHLSFYIKSASTETPVVPHEHVFVEGKCECGAEDPNYVPPHEHVFVDGKCECGESDPTYVPETPVEPENPEATGTSTVTLTPNVTENINSFNPDADITSYTSLAGSEIFTITVGEKTNNNNQVYLSTGGEIRLYSNTETYLGNTMTITSTKKIVSIAITYSGTSRSGATFTIGDATVAGGTEITEETITVNANSVTIANNKTTGQIRITSIVITYEG